jgi:hypothetical protein
LDHKDTRHKNTRHKNTRHKNTRHKNTRHKNTRHKDTHYKDTHHKTNNFSKKKIVIVSFYISLLDCNNTVKGGKLVFNKQKLKKLKLVRCIHTLRSCKLSLKKLKKSVYYKYIVLPTVNSLVIRGKLFNVIIGVLKIKKKLRNKRNFIKQAFTKVIAQFTRFNDKIKRIKKNIVNYTTYNKSSYNTTIENSRYKSILYDVTLQFLLILGIVGGTVFYQYYCIVHGNITFKLLKFLGD